MSLVSGARVVLEERQQRSVMRPGHCQIENYKQMQTDYGRQHQICSRFAQGVPQRPGNRQIKEIGDHRKPNNHPPHRRFAWQVAEPCLACHRRRAGPCEERNNRHVSYCQKQRRYPAPAIALLLFISIQTAHLNRHLHIGFFCFSEIIRSLLWHCSGLIYPAAYVLADFHV